MLNRQHIKQAQSDAWKKPDGLGYCLDCWKEWMLSDDRDLSASRMRLDSGRDEEDEDEDRKGYDVSVYDSQRIADFRIGEATGAVIEDLKPVWRWAMYKKCGIATQWKFPLINFTDALIAAQDDLENKLRKHVATGILF